MPINQTESSSRLAELPLEENDPALSSSPTSSSGESALKRAFARTGVILRRPDQILPIMEVLSMIPALSFGILNFVDSSYAGSKTMEVFLSFLIANIFLMLTSTVQLHYYHGDKSMNWLKYHYSLSIFTLSLISTIFDLLISFAEGVAAGFQGNRVNVLFFIITASFFLALLKLINACIVK